MTTYILENVNGLYDDGVVSFRRTGSQTITNPRSTAETTGRSRLLGTELAEEIEFLTARARSVGITRANASLAPLALKVRSYSVLSLACSGGPPRSASWPTSSALTRARSSRWSTNWSRGAW